MIDRIALGMALVLLGAALAPTGAAAFTRTEQREPCAEQDPQRRPFFGDLHVHTSFSFDSYTSGQRNDPAIAYTYAKGDPIELPAVDGSQSVTVQLRRPLDFAAITDHAEFLGEINTCTTDSSSLAYWSPHCMLTRSDAFYAQLLAAGYWAERVMEDANPKTRSYVCRWSPERCARGVAEFWREIQRAAEGAYDRSRSCRFTSFIGYEYTDTPNSNNLHRNVIFRNEHVSAVPISSYDTGANRVTELWRLLRDDCLRQPDGCDVLAIPHNPNLSGGIMYPDPKDEAEARERLFMEPIVEMIQHKAASECRFDRLLGRGLDTHDELCTFEQNLTDNLASLAILFGEVQSERGEPVALEDFGRRTMIRNVLKDGLALERQNGLNPFRMGFIGSTDTHSAIPGGTEEGDYVGHLGRRDAGFRNVQDHYQDNPGGLAVVWAEENARDSLFEGMRRRETYATSGTRPIVRFFAGTGYQAGLCEDADAVRKAYTGGVPMGGVLEADAPPRLFTLALKDPGTPDQPGTDLQRVQIIKGWVDDEGRTHEEVIDVAGDADNGAAVDPSTCAPTGAGADRLCAVWEDPSWRPGQSAFYYARVLENPTCRWSTRQCQAAGVNPFDEDCETQAAAATAKAVEEEGAQGDVYGACCQAEADQPFLSPVIQERAWTSPIWLSPPAASGDPGASASSN